MGNSSDIRIMTGGQGKGFGPEIPPLRIDYPDDCKICMGHSYWPGKEADPSRCHQYTCSIWPKAKIVFDTNLKKDYDKHIREWPDFYDGLDGLPDSELA